MNPIYLKAKSSMIGFLLVNPKTITGKLKILIYIAIFILGGFSFYVYLQVESIRNSYYKQEKYNFAFQNVFVLQSTLTGYQSKILIKIINRDTSIAQFNTKDVLKTIDTVNYALSLADTVNYKLSPLKDVFVEYENIIQNMGKEIIINNKDSLSNVSNHVLDSIYAVKATENEAIGKYYGVLFGDFFPKLLTSKDSNNEKLLKQTQSLRVTVIIVSSFLGLIFVLVGIYIVNSLKLALNKPKDILEALAQGQLPENIKESEDELNYVIKETNNLVKNLKQASTFALEIGKSNFEYPFSPSSKEDTLGNSLLKMNDDLKLFHEKEKQQAWATNGYAMFAEIIRNTNDSIKDISSTIISQLVKYISANQGGLFLFDQSSNQIELIACYAYNRKKYIQKNIEVGEGLVGQCFQEGEKIYMNDVPEEYLNITSGLGTANPRAILIVPMKYNQTIAGIIELATFNDFPQYKIEFIEKIAEMLGNSFNNLKQKEITEKLLNDSQAKSQNLAQQEEELRQNLEELHATQEELMRREKTYLEEIRLLKNHRSDTAS
ncbi:MAG: GAF domain-containing protein [Cytophagales bacterium]|nr:MAG: GAF domain-containing protein [Cytophagales bacterium]